MIDLQQAIQEYKRVLQSGLFSTSKRLDTNCPSILKAIIEAGIKACDDELKKFKS